MRVLFPFIKLMFTERKWLILGALLSLITLLAGMGLLSLSGWYISATAFAGLSAITAMAFNYLLPGSGVRLFSLLRILGRYGERVVTHEATFRVLTRLRVWVYNKLEPLAPGHLLLFRSGDLLNRLVNDVDAMNNLYLRVMIPTIIAVLTCLVVLCYLSFFNVILAWLAFINLTITALVAPILAAILAKNIGANIQLAMAKLRTKILDHLQGMLELILFSADKQQIQSIYNAQDKLIHLQKSMVRIKALSLAFINLMWGITIWLTLYVGIKIVHENHLNGAILALIILTIMAAFEAIFPLPLAFQYLSKTIMAAKRLLQIVTAKPMIHFVKNTGISVSKFNIEFSQVSFSYPGRSLLLQDFNLNIAEGEKVGVMGETGIGKSTLVYLLMRSWDPNSGKIKIGGINIRDLAEDELRRSMTIISQRPYIFNDTVKANLLLAKPDATDKELWAALEKAQLAEFIRSLPEKLNTWTGEHGTHFSGGQIRRLAVARAILHDAPILILDEPTEGLDNITRHHFLLNLQRFMHNKTVIIISHRSADLIGVDRIVKL